MKPSATHPLLPIFFVIWIFFVLSTFFAVQKPFSAADVGFIAAKLSGLSPLDWFAITLLGMTLWFSRRRRLVPLSTPYLWFIFGFGAFLIAYKPFSVVNMLAFGNVMLDLLTAGWLTLVALGLGSWLWQGLHLKDYSFGERVILGTSLGLGALGLLSFGLGLLHLFHPLVAYSVTVVLSLISWPQLVKIFSQWRRWRLATLPNSLMTVYLSLLTLLTLLVALLPPTDWDGLFYHLTGPKLYLQAGGIIGGIDVPHFNFPSLMEMLFAWAMLLRGDIAAKLLHALFAFLLAGLAYLSAARFFNQKSAWPSVLILTGMPMVSTLAGWAYNDLALAFYQLASLYAIVKWRLEGGETCSERSRRVGRLGIRAWPWLILSGIFAGLAMGMKYTSFVTPVVIGGLLLWWAFRGQQNAEEQGSKGAALREAQDSEQGRISTQNVRQYALRPTPYVSRLTPFLIFAFAATLVALPWYAKNWFFTGNPVYPFLYGLFGGQFWDGFRAAWYVAAGTGIGWQPTTLLTLPWLLTLGVRDVNYWDGRTGPLLLLFLPLTLLYGLFYYRGHNPLLFLGRRVGQEARPAALDPLLIYALVHFAVWTLGVIWSRSLWQSRLLLPGLVALAPVAGWLWSDLSRFRLRSFSLSRFVNIAIGLTLALTLVDTGLLTLKINPLPYLVGGETGDEYLLRRLGAHYQTMQQVNKLLPPEAKVVFLWEPRSYYCQPQCQPDSILDEFPHLVHQYGSAEAIAQAWREAGVSHMLVHRAGLNFVLNKSPEVVNQAILSELKDFYWQEVSGISGAYQLYALEFAP